MKSKPLEPFEQKWHFRNYHVLETKYFMRSKAVVFTAPNEVRWMDVQSPEPGDNDIVIDIHHSWISNGT